MTKIKTDVIIVTTWQSRLAHAISDRYSLTMTTEATPRVIGGIKTTKVDRRLVLDGEPKAIDRAWVHLDNLLALLNLESDAYARGLGDVNALKRKLARRAWLEHAATVEAERILEGKNGRT